MWFLAVRQLLAKKSQTFLILMGICFGTMVYVIIAGVQFGMREYLAEQLLNNTAHVIIKGDERKIDAEDIRQRFFPTEKFVGWLVPPAGKREESRLENPLGWFTRLSADPEVLSYAPRLTMNGILLKGGLKKTIAITGIVPDRHLQVTSIGDYMREGALTDLRAGTKGLVIGSGVAEAIGARLNQVVQLSAGLGEARPFKVVGIVHLGNQQIDDTFALAHIVDVQNINRTPGRVSEISVALVDIEKAQDKAKSWSVLSQDRVQSWQEANANFMQIINIQDIVRLVITSSILLVSAFGIYNVLTIMINQKQKEIAILRSIGYGPEKILLLILIQGLLLGFFGSVIGIAMGHGINLYIATIDLGINIGKGSSLIVSYRPSIYTSAFAFAQVSALIASLLPARHAANLTPLEIIRSNL